MDSKLENAAESGDVEFLKSAVESYPNPPYNDDYFLSTDRFGNNIFLIAAKLQNAAFIRGGIKIIPPDLLPQLFSQPDDKKSRNPLHIAVLSKSDEMVREILGFYKSYSGSLSLDKRPWLALDAEKKTPLHVALYEEMEEIALEIISMDMKLLCDKIDEYNHSPLDLAVLKGMNRVAEEILNSDFFSYSLSGYSRHTPLHYVPHSSEKVLRLLLEKHADLLNVTDHDGWNVLHSWAAKGGAGPIYCLLGWDDLPSVKTKVFMDLIYKKASWDDDTPLHIAVKWNHLQIVEALVRGYQYVVVSSGKSFESLEPPWKIKNKHGDTPFHLALSLKHEEVAMEIMSMDMESLCNILGKYDNSPLFLAVENGLDSVAEEILSADFSYSLSGYRGSTPLHYAHKTSEKVFRLLLEKHEDLLNITNDDGFNVLHQWVHFKAFWPIECLLKWDFPSERTKVFIDLIYKTTEKKNDENPLHIAVTLGDHDLKIVEALVRGYQQEVSSGKSSESLYDNPPWKIKNKNGDTPFHHALHLGRSKVASYFLSIDPTICLINNDDKGKSTIFTAVTSTIDNQVKEQILRIHDLNTPTERSNHLQWLNECPERTLRYLLEKYPSFVINAVDHENEFNVLHIWSEMEQVWPMNYLLEHQIPDVTRKVFTDFMFMVDKEKGDTPLHVAARKKNIRIVQALMSGYQQEINAENTLESLDEHPWKIKNKNEDTPLHVALSLEHKEVALYILSVDPTCQVDEDEGKSTLFFALDLALELGVDEQVFEEILKTLDRFSPPQRKFDFQWLKICPEHFLKYLLKNYPSFMDNVDHKNGFNAIHQWAVLGQVWPLNLIENDFPHLRTKVFREYIEAIDNMHNTPLHIAARTNVNTDFVQALLNGYRREIGEIVKSHEWPLLKSKNINGDTPLHVALSSNNEIIASYILSLDPTLYDVGNYKGESPLFVAVASSCEHFIEEFLRTRFCRFNMLLRNDKKSVLHLLSSCTERICKQLLGKFWWLINVRDENGRTALDEAKEVTHNPWPVNLLENPSLFLKEPFDWVAACKGEEISYLRAFIDNCPDLFQLICHEQKDTPLHHINSQTYEDYQNFLKIASIVSLKNMTDKEGATPLHRALRRMDIDLSKTLLTDNTVRRDIKDHNGITAMDILGRLWKEHENWAKMCEQIKVYPYLKTRYIQPGTNMDQMRNTLTVVAALLATITFAAGFTLPGGLDDDTGYAMFGKKAVFLVFLLADVYAMCTSIVVLFCLIWSMISERDMSYFLVDRSVVILMQSLYGTMLAFMTGIYVVTAHESLWAAILVLIICALIGISVNRTMLHKILVIILPASNKDDKDRIHFPEEGVPLVPTNNNDDLV